MRVAFAPVCSDRKAMGHRDRQASLRKGQLPFRTDRMAERRGRCYVVDDTLRFASDIDLVPRTTPSPITVERHGRNLRPDVEARICPPEIQARCPHVIEQLVGCLNYYSEIHPHEALGYRSLREYFAQTRKALSGM